MIQYDSNKFAKFHMNKHTDSLEYSNLKFMAIYGF